MCLPGVRVFGSKDGMMQLGMVHTLAPVAPGFNLNAAHVARHAAASVSTHVTSCDVTSLLPLFLFLCASSAASCPLGHATESVVFARACGVPAILQHALYELVRRPAYGQPARDGVSVHDFRALVRAREELTAVWILTVSPYSPDLALCVRGRGRTRGIGALQAGKAHYKLARESGITDNYLYDYRRSSEGVLRGIRRAAPRGVGGAGARRRGITWTSGSALTA
ncbi:hypothetical protein FB451DRAFT_1452256 [Mycena latifolia]|nr:hypothetical protein FB451DRAFT_1452256 [Mycena latifolia]